MMLPILVCTFSFRDGYRKGGDRVVGRDREGEFPGYLRALGF